MGSQRYVGSAWGGPCHAMRVGGRRPTASETKYVYLFFESVLSLWPRVGSAGDSSSGDCSLSGRVKACVLAGVWRCC